MPLSNTILNTLSSGPYWDDYDRTKRFHRVLIRPAKPVQTRELNQMQSMLQNQVEQLGAGVFKEGASLTGGSFTFANNVIAVQFIRDTNVDITNFYTANTGVGAIIRGVTSGAEGRVVQYSNQPSQSYAAVVVAPLNGARFIGGEGVTFINTQTNSTMATMTLAPSPVTVKNAAVFSVDAGTFFLSGHMVDADRQSIVLSSNTNLITARVGFQINETVITEADDSSLYDPALGASNYAAPGAHRLKLTATLVSKPVQGTSSIEQNADENFIEIARVIDGVLAQPAERTKPELLEDVLAERTYDESGDYVVSPFTLNIKDHNPPLDMPNMTGTININALSTLVTMAGVTTAFDTEATNNDVLVVNGERRDIVTVVNSSVLYVNTAFSLDASNVTGVIVSSNKFNAEIGAGRAYVRGYQVATTGVTKLAMDRPRTTENTTNSDTGTFFGPYVYVTRPSSTTLFGIDTTSQADLHAVSYENINTSSSIYNASKIGTAYIRSLVFHSGIGDANTIYKMYLVNAEFNNKTFVVDTTQHATGNATRLTVATATVSNTTGYFITIAQNATSATTGIVPTGNGAYGGAKITLYDINGGQLDYYALNSNTTVVGPLFTTTIQVTSNAFFSTINATGNVAITFSDKSIRSVANGVTKGKGLNVHPLSQVGNIPTGNTVVSGSDQTALVFPLRHNWVKADSFSQESFQTIRFLGAASGTTSGANTQFSFSLPAGEEFTETSAVYESFVVANTTNIVPLHTSNVVIAGSTATLTIPTSLVGSGGINVYARVSVNTTNPRLKTLITANTNTSNVVVTSSNVISTLDRGHVGINNINASSSRVVGLGVADVYRVRNVYAVPDPANVSAWVDVTDRYTLDNGQRDWCYDHASLVLKPGFSHYPAANQMLVMIDFFASSSNGYFTAESYTNSGLDDGYVDIPSFTNPKTGTTYILRDCVDFRPIRANNTTLANTASNPYVNTVATFGTQVTPYPLSVFQTNYSYYLPRIDRVVLTKNKEFKIYQGTPSLNPVPPADIEDGITLYLVSHKAYGSNTESAQLLPFEYKRYTMKDIGKLEQRIKNIEYYVQLNSLEQQTLSTPEFDEFDMERYKNGILVDPFVSTAIMDVTNPDNSSSIDRAERVLRPFFISNSFRIGKFNESASSGVEKTTGVVTLSYSELPLINQPLASKSVNINPFNVASWSGSLKLIPQSDTWFETRINPSVVVNLYNENDSWGSANTVKTFGTIWNDWSENWSGTVVKEQYRIAGIVANDPDPGNPHPFQREQWINVNQTTKTGSATRSGNQISARASVIEKNIGDRVVDMSVSQFMRNSNVMIEATGLKPGTPIRAMIDKEDVTNCLEVANEIRLATNAAASAFTIGEVITSNHASIGSATIIGRTSNILRVANAVGVFYKVGSNVTITGSTSGAVANVSSYVGLSGRFQSVVNSTVLVLDAGASDTTGDYVGNTITVTSTDIHLLSNNLSSVNPVYYAGAIVRTITDYDGVTHRATLSSPLPQFYSTTDYITSNSTYSIGTPHTDYLADTTSIVGVPTNEYDSPVADAQVPGAFYGLLRIPAGVFTSGKHDVIVTDNVVPEYASTRAFTQYESTGFIKTVEPTIVSTRNIDFVNTPVTSSKNISQSSTVWSPTGEYIDPLAQTFLIDQYRFPKGVFVSSVDLFFGKKDPKNLPVRVQIRPTNNGYPSSDVIYEEAVVNGNDINLVPGNVTPNPSNTSHYTRFTFREPVYLMPGMEYALVIITNSFEYEVFVGEVGKTIIGDTRVISAQPYGGSFFKSQNARTWTAEQNEDLMFVVNYANFETTGTAYFALSDVPTTNVDYDVINIQTHHMKTADSTQLVRLTAQTTGVLGTTQSIPMDYNYALTERKTIIGGNANSFQMEVTFGTDSNVLSDVYNTERMNIVVVKNIIDNGELYGNGFVVVSHGTMTSPHANSHLLTITGGNGSGAEIYANTNSTGYITSFYVVNAGASFTETPTITVSSANYSVAPTIRYNGETSSKSEIIGENKSRYITRKVSLAEGFDASDIKVYFDASRPSGTNIDVYYKVLATGDTDRFEDKPWTLMEVKPEQASVYTSLDGFKEYEYRTVDNIVSYTDSVGNVFNRFHTFAIKVVMRSTSTTVIPRIRNFRTIALDE